MDSHGKYSDDEIEKMKEQLSELRETNEELRNMNEDLRKENGNLRKELGLKPVTNNSQPTHIPSPTTTVPSTSTSPSSSQIPKSLSVREKLPQTYLYLASNKKALGTLVVDLFTNQAPMTCAKFIKLCTHETGVGYRGSLVYSLNKTWCSMCVDSDLTYADGRHVGHVFPPHLITPLENKSTKHDQERLVTMISNVSALDMYSPRDSDHEFTKSYFAVMFQPKPTLDGKYVVIGKVTDETWPVMEEIRNERHERITIADCGVVE